MQHLSYEERNKDNPCFPPPSEHVQCLEHSPNTSYFALDGILFMEELTS
jgi:hypothetical protein